MEFQLKKEDFLFYPLPDDPDYHVKINTIKKQCIEEDMKSKLTLKSNKFQLMKHR